ncbi:MAG: YchF/TatD family DNA exonuclease [Gemmatimonadetes bacterium]|nr:YchF/TatD family DNA exonuclease [Gemmatimonadota bacterium]NIO33069.1 YchF/TatD family DNA exonuclease [Gemmatimonadota bacterium]
MRLFDSHAHLTDESFAEELDASLARAAERGVSAVVSIASDLDDARAAIQLARAASRLRVYATVGIHPHEADRWTPEAAARLEELAGAGPVVAIGETGLDFYYQNAPRREQSEVFRAQLELAGRLGLPVVVHSREADEDTAAMIQEFSGRVVGVLHCFTGGAELLNVGLAAAWYVSFSGLVTFKNYRDEDIVRAVPGDRLLVETDSPYLAPVPMRGRRNEPAFLEHTVRRLAEIRGEEPAAVAEATFENACRFYGLPQMS